MKKIYWFVILGTVILVVFSILVFHLAQPKYKLEANGIIYRCSVGRGGIIPADDKKEGDKATPAGIYPLRMIYYRPDRIERKALVSGLPIVALEKNDGWCDDVNQKEYNKLVKLPFDGSHEKLWRDDFVYDIIVIIGYNDSPPIKNKGSAIFFHLARKGYTPTVGCVAVAKEDMLKILPVLTPNSKINIDSSGLIKIVNTA